MNDNSLVPSYRAQGGGWGDPDSLIAQASYPGFVIRVSLPPKSNPRDSTCPFLTPSTKERRDTRTLGDRLHQTRAKKILHNHGATEQPPVQMPSSPSPPLEPQMNFLLKLEQYLRSRKYAWFLQPAMVATSDNFPVMENRPV